MNITKVTKIAENSQKNRDRKVTTRKYAVHYLDGMDYAWVELGAGGLLPDPNALLQPLNQRLGSIKVQVELDTTQPATPCLAFVEYEWERDFSIKDGSQRDRSIHPLLRTPEISGEFCEIQEVIEEDFGDPPVKIANSIGEKYEEPEVTFIQAIKYVITRNVSYNPSSDVVNFCKTTNSSAWHGFAQETAMINSHSFTKVQERFQDNYINYFTETFEIICRADTWRKWRLNTSYRIAQHSKTAKEVYIAADGKQTSTPVYYPTEGFKIFVTTNFGSLALPDPTA